jgi:hypothetical protein
VLVHGWLYDPADQETRSVIGNKSYNELIDLLLTTTIDPLGIDGPSGGGSDDLAAAPPAGEAPDSARAGVGPADEAGADEAGADEAGADKAGADEAGAEVAVGRADEAGEGEGGADVASRVVGALVDELVCRAADTGASAICASGEDMSGGQEVRGANARAWEASTSVGGEASTSAGGGARTSAGGEVGTSAGGEARTSAGGEARTSAGGEARMSAGGEASTSATAGCEASAQARREARADRAARRAYESVVVRDFIEGHATQLTVTGLRSLLSQIRENQLTVFFRYVGVWYADQAPDERVRSAPGCMTGVCHWFHVT